MIGGCHLSGVQFELTVEDGKMKPCKTVHTIAMHTLRFARAYSIIYFHLGAALEE